MKLIIGLGNPGKLYAKTRHNLGFMVLDYLKNDLTGKEKNTSWELSKKFNAEIYETTIKSEKITLGKPMTFMNDSGIAVQLLMHFYKLKSSDLIVIHDDKDIKLGDIKIQTNRSDAGHNGIKSIIQHLGTQDFTRVRVGIATDKPKKQDTADFVLDKFGLLERKKVEEMIERTVGEIKKILK
jgi:PTH1 family peptidyl-tRNA hydrolase